MKYDYDTVKRNIAENISYYRKKLNLTQLELAEKINYSDKLVSSWERAERTPDIFTLKELSVIFGVSIDNLTKEKKVKMARPINKQTMAFLYAIIPWVIIAVLFVVFQLVQIDYPLWHLVIFAVSASSLIVYIFNLVWRRIWFIYASLTLFIWTFALSLFLSFNFNAIFFIAAAPIYSFTMVLMYYVIHLSLKTKK